MRGKNKIQVNLVLQLALKRDGGKISRSSADSLVVSYSSVCALHRSSEELVCSHKGIM